MRETGVATDTCALSFETADAHALTRVWVFFFAAGRGRGRDRDRYGRSRYGQQ
jgi:hypothetical protein